MNVTNIQRATHWLSRGEDLKVENGVFFKETRLESFYRCIDSGINDRRVEQVVQRIKTLLDNVNHKPGNEKARKHCTKLADAVILKYQGFGCSKKIQQILKHFDRSLAKLRQEPEFLYKDNQIAYDKWKRCGYPLSIFVEHPDFCDFLFSSQLLSQMKITRDTIEERDGEPCILVEGQWTEWSRIKERFHIEDSPEYKEKFIRDNCYNVYTYLDNGLGLQVHHPYRDGQKPISHLGDNEVDQLQTIARKFVRADEVNLSEQERTEHNKERTFVIQIVSSYMEGNHSNFSEVLLRPKHTYLRIIAGENVPYKSIRKGDVFDFGYGRTQKTMIPFRILRGRFRGPDTWNYKLCQERIVTNIAVTREEAEKTLNFTNKYHNKSANFGTTIGFHFIHQNCSVFVRSALEAININVPTDISLTNLISEIAPDCFRNLSQHLVTVKTIISHQCSKIAAYLPSSVNNTCVTVARKIYDWSIKFYSALAALCLSPIRLVLGEASGETSEAFTPQDVKPQPLESPLFNWKNWFRLSSYHFNLPGILQQWQRQQPSTVIYEKPIRLTIVPPKETSSRNDV